MSHNASGQVGVGIREGERPDSEEVLLASIRTAEQERFLADAKAHIEEMRAKVDVPALIEEMQRLASEYTVSPALLRTILSSSCDDEE